MSTLPTTRQFLTSLINTLTAPGTTPPVHAQPQRQSEPYTTGTDATNPLKSISPQQKALLATMHVIFPPPMLLQALDLLDRGLVVRVSEAEQKFEGEMVESDIELIGDEDRRGEGEDDSRAAKDVPPVSPPQANIHLSPPISPTKEGSSPPWPEDTEMSSPTQSPQRPKKSRNQIHLVRSSQAPKSRFSHSASGSASGRPGSSGRGSGGLGTVYTVRLPAWNCSCAAFAFSSFPAFASSSSYHPWNLSSETEDLDEEGENGNEDELNAAREADEGDMETEWTFGGMSLNGRGAGVGGIGSEDSVPVCKHLLACLLGERWGEVLGRYVKEREVSRDEMAGLGSEG